MNDQYLAELLGEQKAKELTNALASGATILISGANGSGKTTLVNALRNSGYSAIEDFEVYHLTLDKPLDRLIFSEGVSAEV